MRCNDCPQPAKACLFAAVALLATGFAAPSYDELCLQGRRHLEQKQFDSAIDAYSQAIKSSPDQSLGYLGRALAYQGKKDFDRAITDCSEAIRLSPKEAAPRIVRAECHEANKDLDRALADFTAAIEQNPSRAQSYLARAGIQHKKRDWDRAIYDFTKAAELDPQDMSAILGRAQVYSDKEDYDRAVEDYSEAIRRNNKVAGYYFLRARVRLITKEYDRVIADCGEALRLDPAFSAAYGLRGVAWFEKKDYDRAITEFNEVIRQMPADIDAYVWRGRAYREKSDFPKAIADFSEALRTNPKCAAALQERAKTFEKSGDEQKAQADRKAHSELVASLPAEKRPGDPAKTTVFDRMKELGVPAVGGEETGPKPPATAAPAVLVADLARRNAEAEKKTALTAQRAAEAVDAKAVVPEQWEAADDLMGRARALEDKGDYETAAWGFKRAHERFAEAMQGVDRVLASSPSLWLGWAREKADQVTDSVKKTNLWLTMAEASRQAGDDAGYTQAMEKAFAAAKSSALLDPLVGIRSFLAIADVRFRFQENEGALACVREAAACCEGIENAEVRANRFARCAGYFARHGDTAGWSTMLERADRCIPQIARRGGYFEKSSPFSIKCSAYSEAGDWQQAFSQVQLLEKVLPTDSRPKRPEYYAVEYARVAFSAARFGAESKAGREMFERAYVAACADMARFDNWKVDEAVAARFWLARADAIVGASDRAWIAALHLPGAIDRAMVAAEVARKQVELGRYDDLKDLLKTLPPETDASAVIRWVAEAETRAGKKSMSQLKRWAGGMERSEAAAAALAGIGAGTKNRTQPAPHAAIAELAPQDPEAKDAKASGEEVAASDTPAAGEILRKNRTNPLVREMFDKAAASVPAWWLQRAVALTREVPDPLTRASLWLRIASAQAEIGDLAGYRTAVEQATRSVVSAWDPMFFEKRQRRGSETAFRPRFVTGGIDADTGRIGAMIDTLLEIEGVRHQHGETTESIDTLLCALRYAEVLHRFPAEYQSMKTWTPRVWMARISGRFRLRGRSDLADAMFLPSPWGTAAQFRYSNDAYAIAFIEAEDEGGIQREGELFRQEEARAGSAATAFARLAFLAARKGDGEGFRKHAMVVSGLTKARRYPSSPAVFLELARGAAILGETDLAREYIGRAGAHGLDRDAALADVIEQMARRNQVAEARKALAEVRDGAALVRARYAVVHAEAAAPSAKLSTLFEEVESCPTAHEKAAALAGVGATVPKKGDSTSTPVDGKP